MNYKMMGKFIAQILLVEALFMIPAALISLGYGEYNAMFSFLVSLALTMAVALVLLLICKGAPSAFYAKEGLVCVGLSWIVLSLFGCLPFFLSREIPRFIDAFFEIVSGFTTTGEPRYYLLAHLQQLVGWHGRAGIFAGLYRRQGQRLYHASAAGRIPRS